MTFPFPKTILLLVVAIALVTGCMGRKGASKAIPAAVLGTNEVIVTPATAVLGRVASVNKTSRFVVLSYPVGSEPPIRQKLNVYRHNLKVGELRVTGPQNEGNTVADITAGDVEVDDDVRED